MGTQGCKVGTWGTREGTQGIRVGMQGIRVGTYDDDTRVDHSDVTATSSKLPYKAAFPPNKGIKKNCGPPGFQNGLKTGWTTVF